MSRELPCVECGEPVIDASLNRTHAVHSQCLRRILRRVEDLKTAVAVAREERDRVDQMVRAEVQKEMAALRARLTSEMKSR